MFLEDKGLYTLTAFRQEDTAITALIRLQPAHEIFTGHFPGRPVLPGVCMLQISQELLEKATGTRLLMHRTGQVKFLQPVNPEKTPELQVSIRPTDNLENVQVSWTDATGGAVLKYTADFKIV